ncbi:MAG: hypothetical protein HY554_10040 [Elusimicrobia bacterium]|nr:hypothetical protein [Elusimicrobiota bacterium]
MKRTTASSCFLAAAALAAWTPCGFASDLDADRQALDARFDGMKLEPAAREQSCVAERLEQAHGLASGPAARGPEAPARALRKPAEVPPPGRGARRARRPAGGESHALSVALAAVALSVPVLGLVAGVCMPLALALLPAGAAETVGVFGSLAVAGPIISFLTEQVQRLTKDDF